MIHIGSISLDAPVMNAACSVAKTIKDVEVLSSTDIGAVLVGSITVQAREGNPEPRWYSDRNFALNSFGMPNGGIEFYRKHLPQMTQIVHDANKAFILSIAGFSTQDYEQLADLAEHTDVDIIELNLGCPNVTIDGKQKPIVSFDQEKMKEIITAVSRITKKNLTVKLSPYSNPAELQAVAQLITELGTVSGVVTSNTFANSYYAHENDAVLASTYGGMSGKGLQPIALGQVRQFREHLPKDIAVIGVGGIETKEDAELFYQAGADAIQAATLIVREGYQAITALIEERA